MTQIMPWIDLGNEVVFLPDVVMVLRLDLPVKDTINKEFLGFMRAQGRIDVGGGKEAKTMLLTKEKAYLLPVSCETLKAKLLRTKFRQTSAE